MFNLRFFDSRPSNQDLRRDTDCPALRSDARKGKGTAETVPFQNPT
jgi:hypothetical protein